jgi:hypothetical protein
MWLWLTHYTVKSLGPQESDFVTPSPAFLILKKWDVGADTLEYTLVLWFLCVDSKERWWVEVFQNCPSSDASSVSPTVEESPSHHPLWDFRSRTKKAQITWNNVFLKFSATTAEPGLGKREVLWVHRSAEMPSGNAVYSLANSKRGDLKIPSEYFSSYSRFLFP